MTSVLINGAQGRMGQEACQAIEQDEDLTLVAKAGHKDNLKAMIEEHRPDVVLELTNAHAVWANTNTIIDCGIRPVIGASGLQFEQIEALQQRCKEKRLGGAVIPNFSIGAVLMMQAVQAMAKYYSHAEIIEAHHAGKIDAPSATALKTAKMIKQGQQQSREVAQVGSNDRARGHIHDGIPIHSLRLPAVMAKQTVILSQGAELLTVEHETTHRLAFMPGICLVCKAVMNLDSMAHGLEHFL